MIDRDVNGGTAVGVGWEPSLSGTGVRASAARGYLHTNHVLDRFNLDVLIGATVTSLTYNSTTGTPVVSGVKYTAGKNQAVYSVIAGNEVILSAGAVDR